MLLTNGDPENGMIDLKIAPDSSLCDIWLVVEIAREYINQFFGNVANKTRMFPGKNKTFPIYPKR